MNILSMFLGALSAAITLLMQGLISVKDVVIIVIGYAVGCLITHFIFSKWVRVDDATENSD